MSTSVRFTKILTAVALTASIAACNDLSSSPRQDDDRTGRRRRSRPSRSRRRAPAETPPTPPPTVATETAKQPVAVENDDDGPHPPDALATARKLLDDKQYDKALKLASIAVKRMPKRSGAWNTLGRVQLQMGKRKDAIESFEKAVDLEPEELVRAQQPRARADLRQALRGGGGHAGAGRRARAGRGVHVEQPGHGVRAARSPRRRARRIRQRGRDGERPRARKAWRASRASSR